MSAVTTRADDERILRILNAKFHEGQKTPVVLERFSITRSTLSGITYRTIKAAGDIPCECVKRENQDGGMPALWWKS